VDEVAPFLPLFYPMSLDLVYVDYFRDHDAYVDALSAAVDALAPRGMLVGSRYADVPGVRVRAAVDKFSLVTRRAVLATFAEHGSVPAGWYVFLPRMFPSVPSLFLLGLSLHSSFPPSPPPCAILTLSLPRPPFQSNHRPT
jgi:hypothetical protein